MRPSKAFWLQRFLLTALRLLPALPLPALAQLTLYELKSGSIASTHVRMERLELPRTGPTVVLREETTQRESTNLSWTHLRPGTIGNLTGFAYNQDSAFDSTPNGTGLANAKHDLICQITGARPDVSRFGSDGWVDAIVRFNPAFLKGTVGNSIEADRFSIAGNTLDTYTDVSVRAYPRCEDAFSGKPEDEFVGKPCAAQVYSQQPGSFSESIYAQAIAYLEIDFYIGEPSPFHLAGRTEDSPSELPTLPTNDSWLQGTMIQLKQVSTNREPPNFFRPVPHPFVINIGWNPDAMEDAPDSVSQSGVLPPGRYRLKASACARIGGGNGFDGGGVGPVNAPDHLGLVIRPAPNALGTRSTVSMGTSAEWDLFFSVTPPPKVQVIPFVQLKNGVATNVFPAWRGTSIYVPPGQSNLTFSCPEHVAVAYIPPTTQFQTNQGNPVWHVYHDRLPVLGTPPPSIATLSQEHRSHTILDPPPGNYYVLADYTQTHAVRNLFPDTLWEYSIKAQYQPPPPVNIDVDDKESTISVAQSAAPFRQSLLRSLPTPKGDWILEAVLLNARSDQDRLVLRPSPADGLQLDDSGKLNRDGRFVGLLFSPADASKIRIRLRSEGSAESDKTLIEKILGGISYQNLSRHPNQEVRMVSLELRTDDGQIVASSLRALDGLIPNHPPTLKSFGGFEVHPGQSISLSADLVRAWVHDEDGDPIAFSAPRISSPPGDHGEIIADGESIRYLAPAPDQVPSQRSCRLEWSVSDGFSTNILSIPVSITPAVVAGDDPPPKVSFIWLFASEGSQITLRASDLLAHASDPAGQPLSLVSVEPLAPFLGSIQLVDQTMTYTAPNAIERRTHSELARYTVTDGHQTASSLIFIDTTALSDTPQALSGLNPHGYFRLAPANSPVLLRLPGVDPTDVTIPLEGASGAGGQIRVDDGAIHYTPPAGFSGDDFIPFSTAEGASITPGTIWVRSASPSAGAPIPGPDRLLGREGRVTTVSAGKLLANDHDPEGSSLSILDVDSSSRWGGTLSFSTGVIRYTPPPGFHGEDSFSYLVSDGENPVVGEVLVLVAEGDRGGLNIVSAPRMVEGLFQVSFAGIPGATYAIQASESTRGPWSTLATVRAPASGVFEFTDPTPTPPMTRFFRTQELP